jgi:ZIP family zinc transporter/zinc and cadmium transporter
MNPIILSILLGLTAAGANVFGGAVIVQKNWDRSYLRYFVALGAGFMLATALVEMVPESLALAGRNGALLLLGGYLLVHFFEHTITPHFHYGEETHADEYLHSHRRVSVLFGLMIHAFFDGIAITAGFLISPWLGWVIFLAIFLHKIPEGFTVTSVMLASGLSKTRSWFASVMLAMATMAGVLTMAIGKHAVSYGLPVAAGVTIYVAASDLIPEVNREPGVKMALVVFIGVAALFVLDHLVHLH